MILKNLHKDKNFNVSPNTDILSLLSLEQREKYSWTLRPLRSKKYWERLHVYVVNRRDENPDFGQLSKMDIFSITSALIKSIECLA